MLTIGGLLEESVAYRRLERESFFEERFINRDREPVRILIPPLTMREKQWLDQRVHGPKELSVRDLDFELDADFLQNYITYYKQYPTFMEAIM